jgi:4-amino-4-deoxy-L-arabinose transferase-like glycosyltransferase
MTLDTRTALLLAAALASLPALMGVLSPHDLEMHDQAKQALYVVDALDGRFWVPHARGEITTKPPLYTWLAAAVALPFGLTELTVRLPSVLATLGLGFLLFDVGRRRFSATTGLVAVALFVTLHHTVKLAFLARTDMLLAFFVTLAMWSTWPPRPLLFGAALGLATLTKGPVGLAIPLLAVLLDAALRRDAGRLRALRPAASLSLAAAIVAAWLVPALLLEGDQLLSMFGREFLDRLTGSGSRASAAHHPFWYLAPYLVLKLLPASLLLPWALLRCEPARREAHVSLTSWLVAALVVVSLSASKRADYLLPAYPPALLLVASLLAAWLHGELAARSARAIDAGVLASAVAAATLGVTASGAIALGLWHPSAPVSAALLAAAAAGGALLLGGIWSYRSRAARLAFAVCGLALTIAMYEQVESAAAREHDAPILRRFAREVIARVHDEPVDFARTRAPSLQFLLRRNVHEVDRAQLLELAADAEPHWLVVSGAAWRQIIGQQPPGSGLAAARIILRSEARPRRGGDDLLLIRSGPPDVEAVELGSLR